MHLAQMIEILGDFPERFLRMCPRRHEFFDHEGMPAVGDLG